MGSPWGLVCSAALVLASLSSASEEMELPDSFMMQKEVDWTELFDAKEFIEQVPLDPPRTRSGGEFIGQVLLDPPRIQSGGGQVPRGRSFSGPPLMDYPVQFPLGRPTSDNLEAICLHGDRRPRYPDSYFPNSGYGQLRLMAKTVNTLESWFGTCCESQTWGRDVKLCCATKAWELSVNAFCEEDTSIKRRTYECCRLRGRDMMNCFNSNAPNPNYNPTEEIPLPPLASTANFDFNPSSCQRTVITPYSIRGNRRKEKKPSPSQKIDMNFPPGRPTADTIESLCLNQNLRNLYNVKCLRGTGYESLAHQAKTINRVEKGFKRCCKKKQDVLGCADQKWTEELNKFCSHKKGGQVDFHCCAGKAGDDRYSCFQNVSPDPHYNMTSATEELSLNNICDTQRIIKMKLPAGFPSQSFVDQCCPLSEQDKTVCFMQKLEELPGTLCLAGKPSRPAIRHCCTLPSQEAPQCFSKILMDAITKATNASQKKKKKRCPIS